MPMQALWVQVRSSMWWDHIVGSNFMAGDWLANFRVSRNTFLFMYNELKHDIIKNDTVMRKVIPVEQRVAITLCFLSLVYPFLVF